MSRMLSRRMTVHRNNFELKLSGIYVDSDLCSRVKLPDIYIDKTAFWRSCLVLGEYHAMLWCIRLTRHTLK